MIGCNHKVPLQTQVIVKRLLWRIATAIISPYLSNMSTSDIPASQRMSAWTFWRWMGICSLFVVPATLCIGEPMTIVMFAPFFGLVVFVAQVFVWKVSKSFLKQELRRRLLCFLVPVAASGWIFFTLSFFYGRPRSAIALALQEPPPLLFWTRYFEEDGWTDYVVRMHVTLDPSYLKKALERHFNGPFRHAGANLYQWKAPTDGTTCTIETDDSFSFAKISYGAD